MFLFPSLLYLFWAAITIAAGVVSAEDDREPYSYASKELSNAISLVVDGPPDESFANALAYVQLTISDDSIGGRLERTHAQLHADAEDVAAILRSQMLFGSNKRVMLAVSAATSYNGYVLLLACLKNGFSYVNVCTILWHPRFLELFDTIDPAIIIIDKQTYDQSPTLVNAIENKGGGRPTVLAFDHIADLSSLFDGSNTSSCKIQDDPVDTGPISADSFPLGEEAVIFFTSGSTGLPKMAASSFRSIFLTSIKYKRLLISHDAKTTMLCPSGFEDSAGYIIEYVPSLLFGSSLIPLVPNRYEWPSIKLRNKMFASVLSQENVTAMALTPHQLNYVVEIVDGMATGQRKTASQSMKTIQTFGSKMFPATMDNALRCFGGSGHSSFTLYESYGSSEAHFIASRDVLRSKGLQLCDGVEGKIVISDMGSDGQDHFTVASDEVHDGEKIGNLHIRSDHIMMGYLNGAFPLDEDGWFMTGDTGFLKNGELHLTGRSRKSINFRGDELDPITVQDIWTKMMPSTREFFVGRDTKHSANNEAAIVFCLKDSHFEMNAAFASVEKAVASAHDDSALVALDVTSIVAFVDDFPRVARDKVNAAEVERLYMNAIKPALASRTRGNDEENVLIITSLDWDRDHHTWTISDWRYVYKWDEDSSDDEDSSESR